MPPSALDLLIRATFPPSSARVKVGVVWMIYLQRFYPVQLQCDLLLTFLLNYVVQATERFESVYPILKEVALAGVPGSKAMKQVSQQTLTFAVKAAGDGKLLSSSMS